MDWTNLVSAVVGAVIATLSAILLDRSRWRRERHDRLAEVRRTLYGEYLACLSQARNAFRALARDQEAGPAERARTARDGFAPCYALRYQMTITAAPTVVQASERAFRALRDIRDLVSKEVTAVGERYGEGRNGYEEALRELRSAMRQDLGSE
jgi:hypothetical protein